MPIAMVALVGTAASVPVDSRAFTYIVCQLYASLFEWRTGEHRAIGFTANMFLDVYLGHMATLRNIDQKNATAYHNMMSDIYLQARYVVLVCLLYV